MDLGDQSQNEIQTQENVAVVKARLQEEGREARNLIAYSLPLETRKNSSSIPLNTDKFNKVKESKKSGTEPSHIKQEKRHRSASAGRDPQASLRARHWGFLFRNLQQAVDEIYETAEDDESIIECKEAILMLERYTNDFYKLIEWLKIKWEYENTSPPKRPTFLAWEIRTSSPGKIFKGEKRNFINSEVRKALNFTKCIKCGTSNSKKPEEIKLLENKEKSDNPPLKVLDEKNSNGNELRAENVNKETELNISTTSSKIEIKCESRDCAAKESKKSIGDLPIKTGLYSISEGKNDVSDHKKELILKLESSSSSNSVSNSSINSPTTHSNLYASKLKNSSKSILSKSLITNSLDSKSLVKENKTFPHVDPKNLESGVIRGSASQDVTTVTKKLDDKNNTKIEEKTQTKERTSLPKEETKNETKESCKSHMESSQPKYQSPKPGPLVNMNKASQVRKAFNQSRTPVKTHTSSSWRSCSASSSDIKSNCTKQQGTGGRLTVRRLTEGKSTHSPPLNRKNIEGLRSTNNKVLFQRSYTSYQLTKPLTRSCTSLENSSTKGCCKNDIVCQDKKKRTFSSDKVPSSSSVASSSSTSASSGQSWADKVKGNSFERRESVSEVSGQGDDDDEGWEVVRRHRRSQGGSAASLNSQVLKAHGNTSHPNLQKKGSVPFRMQSRFHQPSSAFSMPSLLISSSPENSSQRKDRSLSEDHANGKKVRQNVKKLNVKKKKIQKDYSSSWMSDGESSKNDVSFDAVSLNSNYRCQNSVIPERRSSNRVSNMEKQKKDEANAKTQSESKVIVKAKTEGKGNELVEKITPTKEITTSSKEFINNDVFDELDKLGTEPDVIEESVVKEENICNGNVVLVGETENKKKNNSGDHEFYMDSDSESEREEERMRCNAQAFECVVEREKQLKQQIEEAERASIEVEEDDDDDEDCDTTQCVKECKDQGKPLNQATSSEKGNEGTFYKYDPSVSKLNGLSWAEEMDDIEKMESLRPPGRVLHIHEKLSSPSRKLPISEKLRRHKEKLAKAQELRGKLILAKTEKLKDLFRKIDEVNIDKERLLLEKRDLFERKMERAEEKRQSHLREIVNKAHDEENKAKEIAFINGLEAQNKFLDIMQQHQSHESRLADMAEERSRKQEEKAAKEAAAQERRKALEAERQARMEELCEKRRKRWERIDKKQAERREELLEQAREKARDREERRSALQQAQQAKESELVKKIQQKQEETARRHEENIEQIRLKALESSIMKYSMGSDEAPKLRRYETKKLCTLCNSMITSEVYLLSHLRGRLHHEALKEHHKGDISQHQYETYNLNFIIDAPANVVDTEVNKDKMRQKTLKKRCRKIRTRMTGRGREYLRDFIAPPCKETQSKSRMAKALTHLGKLLSNQGSGPWLSSEVALLDKYLLEFSRILGKGEEDEQLCFHSLGGFQYLLRILNLIIGENDEAVCVIPSRSLAICARVALSACKGSKEISQYLLFSNFAGSVVDFLMRRLNDMLIESIRIGSSSSINTITSLPSDSAAAALSELLSQILKDVSCTFEDDSNSEKIKETWPRIQDIVSYCVSMGITDKISWYFNHIQSPVESDSSCAEMILSAMSLVSTLADILKGKTHPDDPTQLIGTFKVLDACGVVSLLYGLLLHQGGRSPSPPPSSLLSPSTLAISAAATTFLHNLAELDLKTFQSILGSEGISLEFRHIASFLLWYCSHWPCEEILHNIISLVGFFTVNNKENQSIVQSGETPSVLQQLCSLPWQYFSEPKLTSVLFPTLLSCCLHNDDNMNILQQEMSFQVLQDYLNNNKSSTDSLLHILQTFNNNGMY